MNLISPKINKTRQNFHCFLKFSLFYPLYDFQILVQISINNIVWLGSADTKIASQDAVMKVPELTEKWKYPNFRGKFQVFLKFCWKHDTPLQLQGIHYSSAFYSTLL